MVFLINDNELSFPDPALAEPDGFLAVGGDLSIERLLLAYNNGIFPWFSEDDPICWYSPHQRCVIFPDQINVSRSMQTIIRSGKFRITVNEAFDKVIAKCRSISRKGQQGTWISAEMEKAYIALHSSGIAHSIEIWEGTDLAGGLYGVVINRVFCGESMFSIKSNASKTALIFLCNSGRYDLVDCQVPNDHLLSLGAVMINREEYIHHLHEKKLK